MYCVILAVSQTRYFRAKLLGELRDINGAKLESRGEAFVQSGKTFDPSLSMGFDVTLVLQMT